MFSITVQNVTGTRRHEFTADSLTAGKKRASELLRSGVIHYSNASVMKRDGSEVHIGAVSVGGHRVVWRRLRP